MKQYIYIATFALCGSGLAQDQNRIPNQPQPDRPAQAQPATPDTTPRTAGERAAAAVSNVFTDWRLEDLPQPVQKTIREQAAGQKIADIDRETRTGRTLWEVEIEKEGKNTEIHIAEDGTLVTEGAGLIGRTTDAAGRAVTPGERPTATGTPAGTQTGRSGTDLLMGTRWEDLPPAVQQKAMQFGGKEKVADIDREELRGRLAYEVEFKREGRNLEIHFGEDGTVLESNDPVAAPAQGAAGAAPGTATPRSTQPGQPATPPPSTTPQSQPNQNPNQPRP
jgi:uncharacterized membrane protein YkoI